MKITSFEEILAWKKAMLITQAIYHETKKLPLSKDYGLSDQMRRAAVSIASNIAEGFKRKGNKEFIRFLYIAKGSAGELRTQIIIAHMNNLISTERYTQLFTEIKYTSSLIGSFILYLQKKTF